MNINPEAKRNLPVIFMLEQDADDRELTEMIIKESGSEVTFRFFSDQRAFFNELSLSKTLPQLILLGNNSLPENAINLLKLLKTDSRFMRIPVILLSDNVSGVAVQEAYAHGASSFIRKPLSNSDTVNKISTFLRYWTTVVELP